MSESGPPSLRGAPVHMPAVSPRSILVNLGLVASLLFFCLPMTWLAVASIDAAATQQVKFPDLSLDNFRVATNAINLRALFNSMLIAIIATSVATVPAFVAAYSFSRHSIPGKQLILLGIVFLSGVPISILIIPVYQMFQQLDWLSLLPTSIFLGVTSIPFEIYIIKTAIDAIPVDLEDASRLERAGRFRILTRIVIPLSFPGIVAAAIYGFINAWGNFLPPLVLITDPGQQPSPVAIYSFLSSNVVDYGGIAAYSLLYMAPVMVLYLIVARALSGGFVLGGALK